MGQPGPHLFRDSIADPHWRPRLEHDELYTSGVLSVVAPGVSGDYNDDGVVDAADYTVWRDHLGSNFDFERRRATRIMLVRVSSIWPTTICGNCQFRRHRRQQSQCHCSRTLDHGVVDVCGGGKTVTATPGRVESAIDSSTRDTGQQPTFSWIRSTFRLCPRPMRPTRPYGESWCLRTVRRMARSSRVRCCPELI